MNQSKTIQSLDSIESQLKEEKNKYLYLYADFQNFKKQMIKERSELIRFGWRPIAEELLQIIDNLERAVSHSSKETSNAMLDGIQMVLKQFKALFEKYGIQPIDTFQKPFDPHLHEVIGKENSTLPKDTIVKEHIRGYTMNGSLLRPAEVIVSDGNVGGDHKKDESKKNLQNNTT